jgi:Uncharacterized protein conserved in bacteria (DUF2188)
MTALIQPTKRVTTIAKKLGLNTNQLWVSPSDQGGWKVQRPGASRASIVVDTKASAVSQARQIAKNNHLELVVQNKDGKISQKDTFRKDPFPPKW